MKRHHKNKHEGKMHACDQCDKIFSDNGNMKRHVQGIHAGVKFTCDLCEYSASQNGSVKNHRERYHNLGKNTPNNALNLATRSNT